MMKVMMSKKKEYSKEEINFALAVMEVERTLKNVGNYKSALLESPFFRHVLRRAGLRFPCG